MERKTMTRWMKTIQAMERWYAENTEWTNFLLYEKNTGP